MDASQQKIHFRLFISAILIVVVFLVLLILLVLKNRQSAVSDIQIPKNITKLNIKVPVETITAVSYSVDCQITVVTTVKKNYIRKMVNCKEPLTYKISADGKYLFYLEKYIYSLENNTDAVIDAPIPISDYFFDKNNNLSILSNQSLIYYFIPQLFQDYPNNFNSKTNTFINLAQGKITLALPNLGKKYAKISEDKGGIILADSQGNIVYTISFNDLSAQLLPVKDSGVNREKLNWSKRIFYKDNNVFKTVDLDGGNEIIHKFICSGKETAPLDSLGNLFARSPDGTLLAFLVPSGDHGEIMLYDFVKDNCQPTGLNQTFNYRENFAFSPNGMYLIHVDKGINLYLLNNKNDYQLSTHTSQSYTDPSFVTGPFNWSSDSKFVYAAVSKIENNSPTSTSLVRIYFDNSYRGTEKNVINIPFGSPYAVSPEGNKILYLKDKNLYIYDVEKENSSFYQSVSNQNDLNKIVWLRNNKIITNQYGNNIYEIDFDGENYVYSVNNIIKVYDLINERDKTLPNIIRGQALSFFY